ncbi:MAG TPA: hypothetical protein VE988_27620 [Gemmataceae bacterium]|nr:hypothetical protein [Gemmataceae bacterium]
MNVKLLWKEYRTQWALWLALLDVGLLLVVAVGEVLGQAPASRATMPGAAADAGRSTNVFAVFKDPRIQMPLYRAAMFAVLCFGLMSGAMVLAGDKEDGTQTFLDSLTGRRGKLWSAKFLSAVCLTVLLGICMSAASMALGFASFKQAVYIFALGLDAMAWGLLGGAIAGTVLTGALIGIGFMVGSWMLVAFFPFLGSDPTWPKVLLAIIATYASWACYCRDDLWRKLARDNSKGKLLADVVTDWQALMWLARRQGRLVLAGGIVGALALGLAADHEPLIVWPLGTLLLGVICGLAAFGPDQKDGVRFLGSQRFPPGRLWVVKVVFWGVAAAALTVLAWYGDALLSWGADRAHRVASGMGLAAPVDTILGWFGFLNTAPALAANAQTAMMEAGDWHLRLTEWLGSQYYAPDVSDALQLLAFWPLYGFCFGQFFGMIARRPAVALILGAIVAALVTTLMGPSLLFGGVTYGWLAVIPVILLAATFVATRSWLSDRLTMLKPVIGLSCAGVAIVLCMAGFFAQRAFGVPDVGEPRDMIAFGQQLDELKKRPSARLARVSSGMSRVTATARERELGSPTSPVYPVDPTATKTLRGEGGFLAALEVLIHKGWPANDKEFGKWLDEVCEYDWDGGWMGRARGKREWLVKAELAANLPLGMVQDPRFSNPAATPPQFTKDGNFMARLLVGRGLQLQARGDPLGGLYYIDMAFALSRQMTQCTPTVVYWEAVHLEESALDGLLLWLKAAGPDKKLVDAGEKVLDKHLQNRPAMILALHAEYMVHLTHEPQLFQGNTLADKVFNTAAHVPWEKERQQRALRAIFTGLTQEHDKPDWKRLSWNDIRLKAPDDRLAQNALGTGLPPKDRPGSDLSAHEWGAIVRPSRAFAYIKKIKDRLDAAEVLEELYASKVVFGICKYRIGEGKMPAKLADIAPKYLAELPINPVTGTPYEHEIVDKEGREFPLLSPPRYYAPFQHIVHARGQEFKMAVPLWASQK